MKRHKAMDKVCRALICIFGGVPGPKAVYKDTLGGILILLFKCSLGSPVEHAMCRFCNGCMVFRGDAMLVWLFYLTCAMSENDCFFPKVLAAVNM